ncbi:MAG: hypothetical protein Kow0029_20790 [Candidatus Rifleibacteriota bacterium]
MKKKPFDPWTATIEEAITELENGNEKAVFQWDAAYGIQSFKQKIKCAMDLISAKKEFTNKEKKEVSSAGLLVLLCIRKIVTHGLVAPEWLAYAYNQRFDAVNSHPTKKWNDFDSFGEPFYRRKAEQMELYRKAEIFFVKIADVLEEEREKGTFKGQKGRDRKSQYDFLEDRFYEETGEHVGAEVWERIIYKRPLVKLKRDLIKQRRKQGQIWHIK